MGLCQKQVISFIHKAFIFFDFYFYNNTEVWGVVDTKCPRLDFKVPSCNKFLFEVKVDSVLSKNRFVP